MVKQLFVNLPVNDLQKSIAFFTALGFTFNAEFTDEKATCMILGENMFAMLLVEPFFKSFIKKEISDAHTTTEVLNALALESREKVDEIMHRALEAGGKENRDVLDYGWMYNRAFEDLDGHIWEVFFMDETKKPKA